MLSDNHVCTGCAACENACAVDAIRMFPDEEGFVQPNIDKNKCTSCGRCVRVCPTLNPGRCLPENIEKTPQCGCTTDEHIWHESTSGGFFTELCKAYGDKKPIVFGAKFVGAGEVRHDFSDNFDGLADFRKSKYLQSTIGYSFRRCREFLEKGRFVIFSGVPCQIAGLLNYLGQPYENLLTVEVICHGVCSPSVFRSFLEYLSNRSNCKVRRYVFRSKAKKKCSGGYLSSVMYANGRTEHRHFDVYNRLFLEGMIIRKSCSGRCVFRTKTRYADVTLADARKERDLYPHSLDRNWSVVVANTQHGREAVRRLGNRVKLYAYPIELLQATNRNYFEQGPANPRRDEVMQMFLAMENARFWHLIESVLPHCPGLVTRVIRKGIGVLRSLYRGGGSEKEVNFL